MSRCEFAIFFSHFSGYERLRTSLFANVFILNPAFPSISLRRSCILQFFDVAFNLLAARTCRGPGGAWQRFERGEIALFPFYVAFGRELSDRVNGNIWYAEYCQRKGLGESDISSSI